MRPGRPSHTPGARRSEWPGGNFAATTGVSSTWNCSKNAGSGGGGAVQCPEPKILAWRRYAASSCTTGSARRVLPHAHQ